MGRKIDAEALKQLGKNADVRENIIPAQKPATEEKVFTRRKRLAGRKRIYRSFSLNLLEEDYFIFLKYLDENNIPSGSEFLRDILREKGII